MLKRLKTERLTLTFGTLALLSLLTAAPSSAWEYGSNPWNAGDPVVYFKGLPKTGSTLNETFEVEVWVANVTNLSILLFSFSWDPYILNATSISMTGQTVFPEPYLWLPGKIDNTNGELRNSALIQLESTGVNITAAGALAMSIGFEFVGIGNSSIRFSPHEKNYLQDSNLLTIDPVRFDENGAWAVCAPPIREQHNIAICHMQAPRSIFPGKSIKVNATIYNTGLDNESNVEVQFLVNEVIVDSINIPYLESITSVELSFAWATSETLGTYNLTIYGIPVPGETLIEDNCETRFALVYNGTIYASASNAYDPLEDGSKEHPFDTINEGLVVASPGDTVYVSNGTYHERVKVSKSVLLIGENRYNTSIISSLPHEITANNVQVSGFSISGSPFGLELSDARDCLIWDNIIYRGYYSAVFLHHSHYNSIVNNTIAPYEPPSLEVYDGIYLQDSGHNLISGNTIISNYTRNNGIRLMRAKYNSILDNTVSENKFGIVLSYSDGNIVYRNNFVDNTMQVRVSYSTNIWDGGYPSGGNFWGDHNPPDINSGPYQNETGSDGIGDTPYVIDGNNTDRYPLLYPYDYVPGPDANTDGIVDIADIIVCALAFGSQPGDSKWNPYVDLNQDGIIDIIDLVIIGVNFGKTW